MINFELANQLVVNKDSKALVSTSDSGVTVQIMDESLLMIMMEILENDGGALKLQALVTAAQKSDNELIQEYIFRDIYGISFSQWMETIATPRIQAALGVINFPTGRLAPSSITTNSAEQVSEVTREKTRNTRPFYA
jgi:hypothetical protein